MHGRLITKIIYFALSCGGTMGYVPSARLIFNTEKQMWEYFSHQFLMEQIAEKSGRKRAEMLRKD